MRLNSSSGITRPECCYSLPGFFVIGGYDESISILGIAKVFGTKTGTVDVEGAERLDTTTIQVTLDVGMMDVAEGDVEKDVIPGMKDTLHLRLEDGKLFLGGLGEMFDAVAEVAHLGRIAARDLSSTFLWLLHSLDGRLDVSFPGLADVIEIILGEPDAI